MTPRILLVTNIFPPQIGGPATFIDRLGRALSDSGVRVTVVCSSDAPADREDADRPFTVIRTPLVPRERYEVVIRARIVREMARHPRILVNGLEPYALTAARLLRRRYVLKIVGDTVWETARNRGETTLGFDDFQADSGEQARFRREVERRNRWIRQAAHVIVPSEYLRTHVRRWAGDACRVTVVPNGVIEPPDPPRPRSGSPGELRVLFVGRLTNWKGLETALLAVARLPGVSLDVIGDGPCLPALEALCRQLDLTARVTFLRRLTPHATQTAMHAADVLVLTSLYEGLSHTLLEAMGAGLPCVASDCGGNPEIITNGVDGLLVPPEDVGALSHALDRLRRCERERRRLSEMARTRARAFDFQTTVARTQALLLST